MMKPAYIAMALIAAIGLADIGLHSLNGIRSTAGATPDPVRYTESDFTKMVSGKSAQDVAAAVGQPTRVFDGDTATGGGINKIWAYDNITTDGGEIYDPVAGLRVVAMIDFGPDGTETDVHFNSR